MRDGRFASRSRDAGAQAGPNGESDSSIADSWARVHDLPNHRLELRRDTSITSGTPRAVEKVAAWLGEPAEEYDTPQKQCDRRERLDELLRTYVAEHTAEEAVAAMAQNEVVASKIDDARDIVEDPIYRERGDVIEIEDRDLGTVRMQAPLPKMANHGGHVWRTGAELGEDNEYGYKGIIGLDDAEVRRLEESNIV